MVTAITKYFRDAVAASTQRTVNYKDEKFCEITLKEIKSGKITESSLDDLLGKGDDSTEENKSKQEISEIDVLVALRTIATEYRTGIKTKDDLDELTTIFFVPARLKLDSQELLCPQKNKLPWFPREFLKPLDMGKVLVGRLQNYDDYLKQTTSERFKIETWDAYLDYATRLYYYVVGVEVSQNHIQDGNIEFENKFYLLEDSTVQATQHILRLYDRLERTYQRYSLYEKLIGTSSPCRKETIAETDITQMQAHAGQMGGKYPLSPSQRKAIHNLGVLQNGEILAVSGPPGTGKTTLLQSVVANMLVCSALQENQAPIIVATSTNNQAVTNIISSFGNVEALGISNLDKRWIPIESFALYFPSLSKQKMAEKNGYQYTSKYGDHFIDEIEKDQFVEDARTQFLQEFQTYFNQCESDPYNYANRILDELRQLDIQRRKVLRLKSAIDKTLQGESSDNYRRKRNALLQKIEHDRHPFKNLWQKVSLFLSHRRTKLNKSGTPQSRTASHRQKYSIPHYFLMPFVALANFIQAWTFSEYGQIKEEVLTFEKRIEELKKLLNGWNKYHTLSRDKVKKIIQNEVNIYELNDFLDGIRYIEFWLAVHYYEHRWLYENNYKTNRIYSDTMLRKYHRWAMVTPCMVMTCYMLPKQFEGIDTHLFERIDLLIVDEAGQVSPEIAAPSFALAKKAIVVGDEKQIEPVWGISRTLDITLARENGLLEEYSGFTELSDNGLNCSESSLMKVAIKRSSYGETNVGIFLSEHRRSYNEIIDYCNKLVYHGKLEPKRNFFYEDASNPIRNILPPVGYKQITVMKSEKVGGSRRNEQEAQAIINWLKNNYQSIKERYIHEAGCSDKEKDLVAIITPFKKQSLLLKSLLKKTSLAKNIEVGTVHTFQGAEKRIIIFSSVYGNQDSCFFIDSSPNLMNVAVSRAKDSFLFFGDVGCLQGNSRSPSGLLKNMLEKEVRDLLI